MDNDYFVNKPRRTEIHDGKEVFIYTEDSNYSDAFGYEWQEYSRTYTDSTLSVNLSRSRLELNLGFPLEFLEGKTVLELGSGQGRFTEQLVKYAKHVITADMSYAIYHNAALKAHNLTAVRADINHFPKLKDPVDVVFCRGVLQHTENPIKSMHALFENVKDGGLVIFDVYKKTGGFRISFKFFWRPIVQFLMKEETFDSFLKKHCDALYAMHHAFLNAISIFKPVSAVFERLPFHYHFSWDKQYPQLSLKERKEIFRNEFIDMLYSGYDQPMSPEEVIDALAKIGQFPYSHDFYRNHFRCRKNPSMKPIKVKITKNGIIPLS